MLRQKYDFTVLQDMSRASLKFKEDDRDDPEFVYIVNFPFLISPSNKYGLKLRKINLILKCWPEEKIFAPEQIHPYFDLRDELTVQD